MHLYLLFPCRLFRHHGLLSRRLGLCRLSYLYLRAWVYQSCLPLARVEVDLSSVEADPLDPDLHRLVYLLWVDHHLARLCGSYPGEDPSVGLSSLVLCLVRSRLGNL